MPGKGTQTPARVWEAVKVPAPQRRFAVSLLKEPARRRTMFAHLVDAGETGLVCGAGAEGFAEGSSVGPVSRSSTSWRF